MWSTAPPPCLYSRSLLKLMGKNGTGQIGQLDVNDIQANGMGHAWLIGYDWGFIANKLRRLRECIFECLPVRGDPGSRSSSSNRERERHY